MDKKDMLKELEFYNYLAEIGLNDPNALTGITAERLKSRDFEDY